MKRRSREQYVADKLVYHLGKLSPAARVAVLRQVLTELGMIPPGSMEVSAACLPPPGRKGGGA